MDKPTLYGLDPSPPVRACLLTLKALDIPYDYVSVDLLNKEQFSKEFLEKNPQHTVPVLEDDGHFIWDSHAIMAFLVSKYGENDTLYPKNLYERAVVDQRLHFESGVIFQGALRNITAPLFFEGETNVPQKKINATIGVYDFLETFLKNHDYMAGDHLTIADFSIISTVTTLEVFIEMDSGKWPKLAAWIERLKQLPYYEEANGRGAAQIVAMVKSMNIQIV